ncbi:MAG TPA: tryptophan synthase subunit alpha [Candidatus Eremiobacteraceae bacterium]|nr:tryptophan synthase subunit alpha [Candidatus Eremiobacteraceae bacterium]
MNASPIASVFERCAAENRAALIAYLMAGDPSLADTPGLIEAVAAGGADIIELGIPYSDPLADGPTIQAAAQRSLRAGTTFDGVLAMIAKLNRNRIAAPLVAFTYFNPVFVRGVERTARGLSASGFAGAIIPDLPPEEAVGTADIFAASGVPLTFLVAPTTPSERIPMIAERSSGFVYVVSRMGVTGAGQTLDGSVADLVERLRPLTDKPLAVGFGVSTPDHARAIAAYADGVIVGSALIDCISSADDKPCAARELCAMLAMASRRGQVKQSWAGTK